MGEKFNSIEELIENISRGGEIGFSFRGKNFSVLPIEEGILVLEQYNEASKQIFEKPKDIVNYKIDGALFSDIFEEIEIIFRCF